MAPFDVETRWVREVSGVALDNYVEWPRISPAITLTACPVVALPCELTRGMAGGHELVGPPRGEWRLLAAAVRGRAGVRLAGRAPMDPGGG